MVNQLAQTQEIVDFIENTHEKYEKLLNIEEQTAFMASFILLARVIGLLYNTQNAFDNQHYLAVRLNMRGIYEANMMAKYFTIAFQKKSQSLENNLNKWFSGKVIENKIVRNLFVKELGASESELNQLYRLYSRPVHNTYQSVMESYEGAQINEQKVILKARNGFEYQKCANKQMLSDLFKLYKQSLVNSLNTLDLCLMVMLDRNEVAKIKQYIQQLKGVKK